MAEAEKQEVAEKILEGVENPDATRAREVGFSSIEGAIEYFLKEKEYDTSEESKKAITDTIYNYAKLARDKVLLTNIQLKSKGKDEVEVPSELDFVTKTVNFLMKEDKNYKIVYDKDKNMFDLDQFHLTGEPHQMHKILYVQNEVQKFIDKLPSTTPHLADIKEYLTAFVVEHSYLKRLNAVEKGSKGPGEFQSLKDTMKALNGKDDTPSVLKGLTFDEKTGLKFEYVPGMDDNAKKLFEQALANTNTNKQKAKEESNKLDAKIEDVSNENPNPVDDNSKDKQDENTRKIKEIKKFGPVEKTLGEQITEGFYNGKWLAKYIGNLLKTLGNVDVFIYDNNNKDAGNTSTTTSEDDKNKDPKPKLYDKDGNVLDIDQSKWPELFQKMMTEGIFMDGPDGKRVPITPHMLMAMNGLGAGQNPTMNDMMFANTFFATPGIMPATARPLSFAEAKNTLGYQVVGEIMNKKLVDGLYNRDQLTGAIIEEDKTMMDTKKEMLKECQSFIMLLTSEANIPLNQVSITLPGENGQKLKVDNIKDLLTRTLNAYQSEGENGENYKKLKEVVGKIQQVPAKDLILNSVPENQREGLYQTLQSICKGLENITTIFKSNEIQDMFESTMGDTREFGGALTNEAYLDLSKITDPNARGFAFMGISNVYAGPLKEQTEELIPNKYDDITTYIQLLLEQQKTASGEQKTTDADMTM